LWGANGLVLHAFMYQSIYRHHINNILMECL